MVYDDFFVRFVVRFCQHSVLMRIYEIDKLTFSDVYEVLQSLEADKNCIEADNNLQS
jgi:hypothetical protein